MHLLHTNKHSRVMLEIEPLNASPENVSAMILYLPLGNLPRCTPNPLSLCSDHLMGEPGSLHCTRSVQILFQGTPDIRKTLTHDTPPLLARQATKSKKWTGRDFQMGCILIP